jgi:hypothetical protein
MSHGEIDAVKKAVKRHTGLLVYIAFVVTIVGVLLIWEY